MLKASPFRSRSAVAALSDVAQRALELARSDTPLPHVLGGPLPLGAAEALRRRAQARLGGVTGDVFGWLIEIGTCGCLLVTALLA